jgi:hypothetical protein
MTENLVIIVTSKSACNDVSKNVISIEGESLPRHSATYFRRS